MPPLPPTWCFFCFFLGFVGCFFLVLLVLFVGSIFIRENKRLWGRKKEQCNTNKWGVLEISGCQRQGGLKGSLFGEHIALRPLLKAKDWVFLKKNLVHVGKRRIKKGRMLQVGSLVLVFQGHWEIGGHPWVCFMGQNVLQFAPTLNFTCVKVQLWPKHVG